MKTEIRKHPDKRGLKTIVYCEVHPALQLHCDARTSPHPALYRPAPLPNL